MEFISEGIFGKYTKMKILDYIFGKGKILMPFSGLAPSKLVAFVHISILNFQKNRRKGPCGTEKSVVLRGLKYPQLTLIPLI